MQNLIKIILYIVLSPLIFILALYDETTYGNGELYIYSTKLINKIGDLK